MKFESVQINMKHVLYKKRAINDLRIYLFLLNSTIKEKEIQESDSKLHNNKAKGFDTIKMKYLNRACQIFFLV